MFANEYILYALFPTLSGYSGWSTASQAFVRWFEGGNATLICIESI